MDLLLGPSPERVDFAAGVQVPNHVADASLQHRIAFAPNAIRLHGRAELLSGLRQVCRAHVELEDGQTIGGERLAHLPRLPGVGPGGNPPYFSPFFLLS
jgi:hypothetical protein